MKELKADVAMYNADGNKSPHLASITIGKQESESSPAQWDFNKTYIYQSSLKKA